MKASRQLAAVEPMILDPLRGLEGEDWHKAPKGKWSIAQIVSHLAMGTDRVAVNLEHLTNQVGMDRQATPKHKLLRHLALGLGKLPTRRNPPTRTQPEDRPDPELAMAQLRMALQRLEVLVEQWSPEQQQSIYFAHTLLGDLNLREWIRFLNVYGRQHEHKIKVRLRWLGQR
jgi:hypothetical protein